MATSNVRNSLLGSDSEYQRLAQEHSRCEAELEQLQNQSYLNSEDLILESVLKKRKLQLKDQMEQLFLSRQKSLGLH